MARGNDSILQIWLHINKYDKYKSRFLEKIKNVVSYENASL